MDRDQNGAQFTEFDKMSSSEIWSPVQSLQIFRGLKYMSYIQYWYVYIYRFSYVSTIYWNNSFRN